MIRKLEGGPGVMYVGHLSPEFLEPEIRGYFGQFGTIQRCRLSRSKKVTFLSFSKVYYFNLYLDWKKQRICVH